MERAALLGAAIASLAKKAGASLKFFKKFERVGGSSPALSFAKLKIRFGAHPSDTEGNEVGSILEESAPPRSLAILASD